jgi:hypothetical protein
MASAHWLFTTVVIVLLTIANGGSVFLPKANGCPTVCTLHNEMTVSLPGTGSSAEARHSDHGIHGTDGSRSEQHLL